jgi:putative transposase
MVAYIDAHRARFGVEPICAVLPIAPSTYFRHKAEQRDPARRSARAQGDDTLRAIIRRIWTENHQVYGPRKVWKQMGRGRLRAARCRVRRLMRDMALRGAVRGRARVTTTQSSPEAGRPRDLVERNFTATRSHLARLRLCRLRHRRLCAAHCRLARLVVPGDRLRPRRARASDL